MSELFDDKAIQVSRYLHNEVEDLAEPKREAPDGSSTF